MQCRQLVIRYHWEHVMLYVVVHIPIDETTYRIHVCGATIQAVVYSIVSQTCVLDDAG